MAIGLAALYPIPRRLGPRRIGLAAMACCLPMASALAFPVTDQTTPTVVPSGSDLSAPDAADLQHQMGLASGFASFGNEGGWTILPRITAEEAFTDNVYDLSSPRQWDLTTIITPGVAVLGDTSRVQLRLNYAPSLEMHIEAGDQNILAQQLNAVGTVTLVPDLFYVDLRALAGVQETNGGIGGLGGLGASGAGGITAASSVPTAGTEGISKRNRAQTAIISIAPYILDRLGDVGTIKLGVSASRSSVSQVTGFAPIPLVTQGTDSESLTRTEEYGQFQTGDQFTQLRDTFTADAQQSFGYGNEAGNSTREIITDRVDYQINRTYAVYGQVGWEDIDYTGTDRLHINGPTWQVGTTVTPNQDSQLSLGYGYQYGGYTFDFSGRYALTPRTTLTGSFTNGVGTQLEQLNDQLDQAGVSNQGSLENSLTGAPLFVGNNALGVQGGIFRYNYLSLQAITTLDVDQIRVIIGHSEETQIGTAATGGSNGVWTGTATWTHQFTPDLSGTVLASYSLGSPIAGFHSNSLATSVTLQYVLSETVSTFARYTYYNRQANIAGESFYQDLFLVGITKQF